MDFPAIAILMLMYDISDEYIVNKFTDHLLVNVNLVASYVPHFEDSILKTFILWYACSYIG